MGIRKNARAIQPPTGWKKAFVILHDRPHTPIGEIAHHAGVTPEAARHLVHDIQLLHQVRGMKGGAEKLAAKLGISPERVLWYRTMFREMTFERIQERPRDSIAYSGKVPKSQSQRDHDETSRVVGRRKYLEGIADQVRVLRRKNPRPNVVEMAAILKVKISIVDRALNVIHEENTMMTGAGLELNEARELLREKAAAKFQEKRKNERRQQ